MMGTEVVAETLVFLTNWYGWSPEEIILVTMKASQNTGYRVIFKLSRIKRSHAGPSGRAVCVVGLDRLVSVIVG
jgi:hypothetical protein